MIETANTIIGDVTTSNNIDGEVNVGIQTIEPVLQEKSTTPTTEAQEIVADENYNGLSKVNVGAIPSEYIIPAGTLNITTNGTYDVTQYAGANVNTVSAVPNVVEFGVKFQYSSHPSGDYFNVDLRNVVFKCSSLPQMFKDCTLLKKIIFTDPAISLNQNFTGVGSMDNMFVNCSALEEIQNLSNGNFSNVYEPHYMFSNCTKLNDETLNDILLMCTKMTRITSSTTKKLSYLGLSSSQRSKMQNMSNAQAFRDAGWSFS